MRGLEPKIVKAMMQILDRASGGVEFDEARLLAELEDLILATGTDGLGDVDADLFSELANERTNHRDLADRFQAVANATDPVGAASSDPEIRQVLDTRARLKSSRYWTEMMKRRERPHWSFIDEINNELALLRELAAHMAAHHDSQVTQGRPRKDDLDTLGSIDIDDSH